MRGFKGFLSWAWDIALFGVPGAYALDSSNDGGSRAVAAAIVVIVYLHFNEREARKRHEQILTRLDEMKEAAAPPYFNPYSDRE